MNTVQDYCINLTLERVYRLDLPSALSHPFEHDRALPCQVEVRVPGEPQHFKEWLDQELVGLAKGDEWGFNLEVEAASLTTTLE